MYQVINTCKTYIDDILIDTHSVPANSSAIPVSIDVSSYSGIHRVKVVLTGGADLRIGNIVLNAYTAPVPNFSCSFPNSPTNPLIVKFTDTKTADPVSWL